MTQEAPSDGIGIVGAGGWGTALAVSLARHGALVTLWARSSDAALSLLSARENRTYLPGVRLPDALEITADLAAVARHRFLILAVPSQGLRDVFSRLVPHLTPGHSVLNAAKGIEVDSGLRLTQVLASIESPIPYSRIGVLSGPNHAEEVGRGQPTATVVASSQVSTAIEWQKRLINPTLRVYTNDDVVGVELGGALKNIIALAAGICDGLGFGDNTKAALMTRGIAEISRLGVHMGAKPETFSGLSGIGDLIATCTSPHSRNAQFGRKIGEGVDPRQAITESPMVIEGVPACKACARLANRHGIDMPITQAVYQVIFHGKSPLEAVDELMSRDPKNEPKSGV